MKFLQKILLSFSVATSISFVNANAASFDCTKATATIEKTICGNSKLSDLDEKLAEAYKIAQANSQDPVKLKIEQIEWIKESRNCHSDVSCIELSYNKRLSVLDSLQPKLARETQVPAQPSHVSTPEPVASAVQMPANSVVVELSSPSASVATQTVASPHATVAVIANYIEANSNIFFNEAYQRYALIAVGAIFGVFALFYILRFLIALAKKELSDLSITKISAFKTDPINIAPNIVADFNIEGSHKGQISQQADKSKSTILPIFKEIWLWYKGIFDAHPIKTGVVTIIIIGAIFGDNKMPANTSSSAGSPAAGPAFVEKLIYPLKVKDIGLGLVQVPCLQKEETYLNLIQKPVRVQFECTIGFGFDTTDVVFSSDGKTVVRVTRNQYLTSSDPEPSEVIKAAMNFYGTPKDFSERNWLANYGDAYTVTYNGNVASASINKSGVGLLVRGYLCNDDEAWHGGFIVKCINSATRLIKYDLINIDGFMQQAEDGKARMLVKNQNKINSQKF
jgi:uncharacterized protein